MVNSQSHRMPFGLMPVLVTALLMNVAHPVHAQEPAVQASPATPTRKLPDPLPQTSLDGLEPVTTKSGLIYYDIIVGTGTPATPDSRVAIRYVCWLPDGTTFDSSEKLNKPAVLRLYKAEIIDGWKEGIGSMREGGVRRLEVPWNLGYGEEGKYPVPPKQDLIFEINLVKVFPPDAPAPGEPNSIPSSEMKIPQPTPFSDIAPVVTDSGLKYWDIKVGEGPSPSDNTIFKVHSTGWLQSGKVFESTKFGEVPATLSLKWGVKGWSEGVRGMKVGGIRRLEVSPELGFGELGRPPAVPPNETLVYELELLEVMEMPSQAEQTFSDPNEFPEVVRGKPGPPVPQTRVDGITPVTTESGLKYWEIKEGTGPAPQPDSTVKVHYSGWLTDGRMFDSSVQRGEPATFSLQGVIKGWTEGVGSMKVGGKRRLEIPPQLGYGKRGHAASQIPPGATLIFEIELLEVK